MSEQRVICTYLGGIKREQIHDLNRLFRYDTASKTFVPDPAALADVAKNIGNLIGYLNKAEAEQYPSGGQPPVDPADPLARFNSAPSQWAKWHQGFLEPQEQWALKAKYDPVAVGQHINWWDGEGYKLQGERRADGTYWYRVPKPGPDPKGYYGDDLLQDINGAADAYVKAELSKPSPDFPAGRQMIAPLG